MSKDNKLTDPKDIKKAIGSPKIIFVLGGPASGKGTQCEKMVEEFGYTHISTGDLMRQEMAKGTKEGDRIKKIVADGGLVPFELTVQILINALIATPSENYLIDGFPRAVDQAIYFEQNVIETQQVLFYDVPQDIMLERCMKRAETSGRSDDNAETIKKRVQNYFDTSYPVVEYYQKFGKVRKIDATGGISDVYKQTKEAVLPQTMFIMGPKASGKTMIAQNLQERTNMNLINFNEFVQSNGFDDADDETVTMALIDKLSKEVKPRVILENFPQNVYQAKFFLRNCKNPSNVFSLECSKEVCQERMSQMGQGSSGYVPSAILSQKIKSYYQSAEELLPFLQAETNFIPISTDRSLEKTMEEVNDHVEPTVIHIRPGANSNNLRKEITDKLASGHEYMDLDINALIRDENERKTSIGIEMHQMVQSNRIIPAEMIVRMLKKIIYSGQPQINKFILTSFPDIIEQAKEFELNCSKIKAIIYSTAESDIVEIKNNNLSLFNIDSLFQKEFRLKTMSEWDFSMFNEKLGNKTDYGVIMGRTLAGKSTLAKYMAEKLDYTLIDMKAIKEEVKKSMGTEEEPFEGEVPLDKVEQATCAIVSKAKGKLIFDGLIQTEGEAQVKFLENFGLPNFVLSLTAGAKEEEEEKEIQSRWSKANEDADCGEDQQAALKEDKAAYDKINTGVTDSFKIYIGRVQLMSLNTKASLETTKKDLEGKFNPKVILINHEKRLGIDTTCANLAIKFNMLYISVYQIIKLHIEGKTEWGAKLLVTKREKDIILTTQVRDEFNEAEYSPVHFDQNVIMQLLQYTISTKRTNQQYVILEGLCNNSKLSNEDDKHELRCMDEFFDIEKNIGSVQAIIGLQFNYENETIEEKDLEHEKFDDADKEDPKPVMDEDGNPVPPADGAKAAYRPSDYEWTITNRMPKNLPQVFMGSKGKAWAVHEVKSAEQYSSSQYEAISKSLDEICNKVVNEPNPFYYQIIFTE